MLVGVNSTLMFGRAKGPPFPIIQSTPNRIERRYWYLFAILSILSPFSPGTVLLKRHPWSYHIRWRPIACSSAKSTPQKCSIYDWILFPDDILTYFNQPSRRPTWPTPRLLWIDRLLEHCNGHLPLLRLFAGSDCRSAAGGVQSNG